MKRFLVSLLMVMGIAIVPVVSAVAQPAATDQAYESELIGEEIELGTSGEITFIPENFDISETDSFQEEYIWFTYGWSNFQLVFVNGPTTPADYQEVTLENMVAFYDSWEVIDEETTDETATFVGLATLDGSELIVYFEFRLDAFGDTDHVFMQFTDASTLVTDLQMVQDEVTIGGGPLLEGTDAEAIAAAAGIEGDTSDDEDDDTGTSGRTNRTNTTDDDEDVSTPESDDDEDTNTGSTRTSRGTSDTTGNSTETGDDDEVSTPESDDDDTEGTSTGTSRTGRTSTTVDTDDNDDDTGVAERGSRTGQVDDDKDEDADATVVAGGDWSDMGLVSDSEWESPTYGAVITWDTTTWEFPQDYDEAIYISDDPPYDVLTLQTTDGLGYVYLTVDTQGDATPESMVEWWSSPEYADRFEQGMTLIETSSTGNTASVVYETTNMRDQSLFVVIEVTFLEDGTMVFSQISAAPTTIHEVYGQFVDDVELNGAPIETTWTVEDIQELSGN